MEINPLNSYNKVYRSEQTNKTKKVDASANLSDNVSLSAEAKEALEFNKEIEKYREIVRKSPDIRASRVAEVKEKISSEAYFSEIVAEKLADKIAESLGIRLT